MDFFIRIVPVHKQSAISLTESEPFEALQMVNFFPDMIQTVAKTNIRLKIQQGRTLLYKIVILMHLFFKKLLK